MAAVIEVRNLTKQFGNHKALDGLDLAVEAGEIYGFLGPNGAGKTTTIRILLGLIRPSGGKIVFFGNASQTLTHALRRHIGALVELPAFFPFLSGRENLWLLARTLGKVDVKQIESLLQSVNLHDRADDAVRTYSQGMRQRLGIAQALLGTPKLVILDEPTNGLDPNETLRARDLIKHVAKERGVTFFISSHLLAEVETMCTSVAVIRKGKHVAAGCIDTLLSGLKSVLELSVGDTVRARAVAAAVPGVGNIREENGRLLLDADFHLSAKINRELADAGIEVHELIRRQKTLEEFFRQMTLGQGDRP